jgi:exonuclease SbcC
MIPVKLKLKNFMCYRDNVQPLLFDSIHLACLAGDNGHGKSAIIDAMTWALWGKARAGSDDDLINTTQQEMEVEFDFTVEKQLYRIIRKRSRPKKRGSPGQPSLELQISNGNGFHPITGNTISQTQEKIISILHMDYETFINSAYLRQGHADEFTRQVPSKRKEILGNILGLAIYDELEERAKEMSRQQETERIQLESAISIINEELARKPEVETELEQAQAALSDIEKTTAEKEARFNEARQKRDALQGKQTQREELEGRIAGNRRELANWQEQAEQHRGRIKEFKEIISRRDDILTGYEKYAEAKRDNEDLDKKFRQSVTLDKQKTQLENRIKEASQNITTEHTVVQREIKTLEERTARLPEIKKQLSEAQAKARELASPGTALERQEQEIGELQTRVNQLEAENARLEKECRELAEKLDLIATQTEGKCPLCETELTREGLKLIGEKYTEERLVKTEQITANRAELEHKRLELNTRQREKKESESSLGEARTQAQSRVSVLLKESGEIEKEGDKLNDLRATLNELEERLAGQDFAVAERTALGEIETALGKLDYDTKKHEETRETLVRMEPYDVENRKLEEAEKLIDRETESLSSLEGSIKRMKESLESETRKVESLTAELASLPELLREAEAAEAEYKEIAAQRSRALEAVGSIKAKIERLNQLEAKKREQESKLSEVARESGIYAELARAFGKTGIQALLIETALPEIEQEANRLLGRMTDNRMHIKFETQRETKKGTVQETLDINISDELGTRNYEMFSGGEAFRINFAIRIALSRLLARRAGAPLPTLIIDEGFGTQDSTGMEKLIEAINSIQDDFEKILVITHMADLKDVFPTRIDVTKTAEGSTITVS